MTKQFNYYDLSDEQLDEIDAYGADDLADWWIDTRTNALIRVERRLATAFETQNTALIAAGTMQVVSSPVP